MTVQSSSRRFRFVFLVILRHALLHVMHKHAAKWPRIAHRIPGQALPGPQRVRVALEEIGGTFIKFGQMLAMQSDMLPLQYCSALFGLFDQVPPFEYEEVERTFQKEVGRFPLELFEEFEKVPIATGSIGQVHVARLRGQKVAVKVRRPSVVSDFEADIRAMRAAVKAVKLLRIRALYWIIAPTEEFIAWTQDELDYRREAHYMEELGRNARDNRFEKVPRVFWSCTTAKILTAEFLEGLTVAEYLRKKELVSVAVGPGFDASLIARRLIDNFLGDAFRHGMFHADLHPGNLMIMPGNIVGYIDFGISGVLSRYSRRHLISMTLSYARGDLDEMCDSFFRITTFDDNADREGFRRGLREASVGWYGGDESESRLRKSITSIMLELLLLSRANGIWPQRDVVKYIRSAIALDGLVKTFAPGLDIGMELERACERHIKWDSVQNLIAPDVAVGWFGANAHLVRDGLLRAVALLRKSGRTGLQPIYVSQRRKKTNRRRRITLFGLICIIALCAMVWWPPRLTAAETSILLLCWLAASRLWPQDAQKARDRYGA